MNTKARNILISLGIVSIVGTGVVVLSQDCLPGRIELVSGDETICFTKQEYRGYRDFLFEKYETTGKLKWIEYELYAQILNIEFQRYKKDRGELIFKDVDLSKEGRMELTKRVQREVRQPRP